MTVDPSSPEGRRRTKRGLRVGIAALLALGTQGAVLTAAIGDSGNAWLWILWGVVLAIITTFFFLESRLEGRRRRQPYDISEG